MANTSLKFNSPRNAQCVTVASLRNARGHRFISDALFRRVTVASRLCAGGLRSVPPVAFRCATFASLRSARGAAMVAALVVVLVAAACGTNDASDGDDLAGTTTSAVGNSSSYGDDLAGTTTSGVGNSSSYGDYLAGTTVALLTHDSFSLSPETLEAFTASTGVLVEQLSSGDAGTLVSQACLTAGEPLGDVLFGIDNTFLQRGLDCGLFEPYESAGLAQVPDRFELDPQHHVTPIDFGDVCINYWIDAFDESLPPPASLDDLIDPAYDGMLVVQSPETSSPGMAFLLATIARYGDGWEDYWAALRDNNVLVTSGWEDAYYGDFVAGGGERPLVVSYASSPPAEVLYADPPVDAPPTGVVTESCYRQIEFAGVLAGAVNPRGAEALIDFMLTPTFQEDVPLNMFVFPVVESTSLPEVFVQHAETAENPFMVDPAEVETQRNAWTDRWVEIVLR